MPDEDLMMGHRDGDSECFEILVDRYRGRIFSFLMRMGFRPARAEELAADVFLKVHRAAPRYEPTAKFSTYLYTVARRAGLNAHDRLAARLEVATGGYELDQGPARHVDAERQLAAKRSVALLDEELAKLSEGHRAAFTLYYGQGLSCADVAVALEISSAEAKGRLAYARKLLRQRLSGRVPEATSPENRK
jgi:RNA polymerase sigma-70 factor (ECF subfamily)